MNQQLSKIVQNESYKASLKTKPAPLFNWLHIIKLNEDASLKPYSQQRAVLIKNVINQPQEMSDASNKPLHFTRRQKSSPCHDGDISVFLQKSQICPSLLSSRIIKPDSHCGSCETTKASRNISDMNNKSGREIA